MNTDEWMELFDKLTNLKLKTQDMARRAVCNNGEFYWLGRVDSIQEVMIELETFPSAMEKKQKEKIEVTPEEIVSVIDVKYLPVLSDFKARSRITIEIDMEKAQDICALKGKDEAALIIGNAILDHGKEKQ